MMREKRENLIFAAWLCTLGFVFAAGAGACSKLINHHVPVVVILFFQNTVCLLFNLPQILQRGVPHLKTARYGLHFVRDAAGFSSFLCLFAALKSIPLINAMLLSYTEPLWIPLIAWIWPGVRMRGHIWWGIVVGFFGMVLILQPSAGGHNLGTFLAILSGILAGLTFILIHRLASTEPTYRILFYNSLFGMLITAPLASFYLSRLSMVDLFCLIGVGGFTFISQYLVTYAFKHGNATMLGSLAYTVVLFSGVLGWALWGEIPNSISLFGMILVIIGGICAVYFEKKYQKSIL